MSPNMHIEGALVAERISERHRQARHRELVRAARHATRWARRCGPSTAC
jgi:hypothetical protein